MFTLENAAIHRARSALDVAYSGAGAAARRKAFEIVGRELLKAESAGAAYEKLQWHGDELVSKAAAANLSAIGSGAPASDMQALAQGFIASIAERSLFDVIYRYGRPMPKPGRIMIGSGGATADGVTVEAGNIPWVDHALSIDDAAAHKTAAIVALTKELAMTGGPAFERLFSVELENAIVEALNQAVVNALLTGAPGSASAGSTALASLQAGLAELDRPAAVVVAAEPGDIAELALSDANKLGAGLRGGELLPGVAIVPVPGITDMVLFEVSQAAIWDGGLTVDRAEHADLVTHFDSHGEPTDRISLWQTGAVAIRGVRSWAIGGAPQVVVVS